MALLVALFELARHRASALFAVRNKILSADRARNSIFIGSRISNLPSVVTSRTAKFIFSSVDILDPTLYFHAATLADKRLHGSSQLANLNHAKIISFSA